MATEGRSATWRIPEPGVRRPKTQSSAMEEKLQCMEDLSLHIASIPRTFRRKSRHVERYADRVRVLCPNAITQRLESPFLGS
jgi:hypothetical protein